MKSWKIITIVVAVGLVATAIFTASAYAMMGGQTFSGMHGTYTSGNYAYYGNMMNSASQYGLGGMMTGYAYNQPGTDCGNHDQFPNYATSNTNPINITTAQTDAQNYIATLNNPDLTIKQVEEYSNNFYIQVAEKSTGSGAFELIVDKYTGAIFPEMGPNMMWNIKYATQTGGIMSGSMMGAGSMMSGYSNTLAPTTTLPVNADQAITNSQQYIGTNYPGTTTGDVTNFYGYYTIEVLNNGNTYGMISVNGFSGQVWYHTWHGSFIQEL